MLSGSLKNYDINLLVRWSSSFSSFQVHDIFQKIIGGCRLVVLHLLYVMLAVALKPFDIPAT
jgi:hypothetical protein